MNDHDLIRLTPTIGGHTVACRCGWEDTLVDEQAARDAHGRHYNLAVHVPAARQALKGGS